MIPPTFDPTDTEVAAITAPDGSEVQEVRDPDGNVVFSAGGDIPDGADLHAHYSAKELSLSDGDSVSTWSDGTGNSYDLTAGTAPTYIASGINGYPSVRFDGVDDFLDAAWTALSQPNHIFFVTQLQNYSGGNERIMASDSGTQRHNFDTGLNDNWTLFAGTGFDTGNAADTNAHIHNILYDGATSGYRQDGTDIASGDAGTEPFGGITVGAGEKENKFGEVDVAEMLVYPQDKSGVETDVENYLSNEWGITI